MSKTDKIRLPKPSEIKQSKRPLTKKEQILVKFIVEHFSLDKIQEHFEYSENINYIPKVEKVMKAMGAKDPSYRSPSTAVQYYFYALQNYHNIKNGDFSQNIEVVQDFELVRHITEEQIVYKDYKVRFVSLPSLLEKTSREIMDDFWSHDTDSDIIDYGDTNDIGDNDPPDVDYLGQAKNNELI